MLTNALSFVRSRKLLTLGIAAAIAVSSAAWITLSPDAKAEGADAKAVAPQIVIGGNFPDPDVSKFGDKYYAYATNGGQNLPVATSDKPGGEWAMTGADGLPKLGAWAQPGRTWAPDVSQRPDGSYLLYYTAHSISPDRQCIGAATSAKPEGPFEPVGDKPIVCPADEGGAIDASSFTDGDKHYLIYKTDANAIGKPPVVYLQETSADGVNFIGDRIEILRNDQDAERGILEAPVMVKQGGNYVLFYAGGEYWNDSYFTSYATSTSLTGPFKKAFRPLITGSSVDGAVNGPGGADVVRGSDGVDHIFFHGHVGDGRSVYLADLGWAGDLPVVRGSRVRYEGENGKVNNCKVRDNAAGASQGKVVAYIDHADSYVDIDVYTPSAGNHTVSVGFANGSQEPSSHKVSVNGTEVGAVTYPITGWDNWQQANVDVDLKAGWNTLRFGKGTAFAELDYIEVR
ncbi:family 43 glycosylhydrolase [Stackebrandtia nassauensis]|uniref:Glycoside hydrolase family 43 n=1 Tax=Stackebrandtia nassauensis (strain DSM 44728 / CIP 108903 / NRRL B-16338 / NBRC 102104 / LLR-40K-21) TaxID=446470 RepID=D3PZP9_STANL|nr:family 43 glycosylhydrolase [Stackebrandtia nassauensis]ADD43586.1 glycoside hydrolase family 43 [Stackebrandtia nassauensis DSM 44728]